MRSDSLIRLNTDSRTCDNERLRREIASQVDQFLASGGEIKVIQSMQTEPLPRPFNRSGIFCPMSGKLLARPGRSEENGRVVLNVRYLETLLGMSDTKIRKLIHSGQFPAPIKGMKPMGWDEEVVLAWMAK